MIARVVVKLKPGVLDPAGQAVEQRLRGLGFDEVKGLTVGKYLEVEVEGSDPAAAKARVEEMCQRLLANPVVERYEVEVE